MCLQQTDTFPLPLPSAGSPWGWGPRRGAAPRASRRESRRRSTSRRAECTLEDRHAPLSETCTKPRDPAGSTAQEHACYAEENRPTPTCLLARVAQNKGWKGHLWGAVTVFMWGRGWSLAFFYFQSLVCDKHRMLLQ